MGNQQVLLRGGSWRKQILLWALVVSLGLLVLHILLPGTVTAVFSGIFHLLSSVTDYMSDILDRLKEIVHSITSWYR